MNRWQFVILVAAVCCTQLISTYLFLPAYHPAVYDAQIADSSTDTTSEWTAVQSAPLPSAGKIFPEEDMRRLIAGVLREELAKLADVNPRVTNRTTNAVVDKEQTPEQLTLNRQSLERSQLIVEEAIAKGEWSTTDVTTITPLLVNLQPEQVSKVRESLMDAINRQQVKMSSFGLLF